MTEFTGVLKLGDNMHSVPVYNNGHWEFPEKMGGNGHVGFIYLIRDNVLWRFYLGKKSFTSTVRGQTRESEWKHYKSSSKTMVDIFAHRPIDEFSFICLEQYKSKGTLSYGETWTLCFVEAPTNIQWYNTRIEKVSWSVKEPISDRHKRRLMEAITK